MSDDLCMHAIWGRIPPEEYTRKGLESGLDIFLVCHTRDEYEGSFSRSLEELKKIVQNSKEARDRVSKKIDEIRKLKDKISRRDR